MNCVDAIKRANQIYQSHGLEDGKRLLWNKVMKNLLVLIRNERPLGGRRTHGLSLCGSTTSLTVRGFCVVSSLKVTQSFVDKTLTHLWPHTFL